MTLSSAGVRICEPTFLYNALVRVRCGKTRSILDGNYLVVFDVRMKVDYDENHCLLAKHVVKDKDGTYNIPFGVDLTLTVNCIVYDSRTVSVIENTAAVSLAKQIANAGSRNTVHVLKGGYERFSAEYPFLRTNKIMYTPLELEHLPLYPSEILPLFLYLGDRCHAYNPSLNHDMKINAHVNMASELYSAFPGSIPELHVTVEDTQETNLTDWFDKIYDYIESCRKKSQKVLVFGQEGISRGPVAVMAYLMKYKEWTMEEALEHVCQYRCNVRPMKSFLEQLKQWENTLRT